MAKISIQMDGALVRNREGGPARRTFFCRFVRAGVPRMASGEPAWLEILPQALQQAVEGGLFDNRAVFVDHAGPQESGPSLHNLVGVTSNAAWSERDQCVEGLVTLYSKAAPLARLLDELLAGPSAGPDVGLSIVFWPVFARRPRPSPAQKPGLRQVVGIREVESVDLVFKPAADGRVLQALSASRVEDEPPEMEILEGGVSMDEHDNSMDWLARWAASEENEPDAGEGAAEPAAPQAQPAPGSGRLRMVKLSEGGPLPGSLIGQGHAVVDAYLRRLGRRMINASGLPEASQQRLLDGWYASPEQVEEAIQRERQYLGQLTASGVVQVGGQAPRGGHVQAGLDGLERISLALDALLVGKSPGGGIPPLSGIREAYLHLSGDYEMTGVFNSERVSLANVNSSTMAGLVANALNKAVVNAFQQYPRWWEKIVVSEDFASLQQVKWVTLGGVGELPTVGEGASYSELSWDDQTETASFVKKGGYLGITLESIDKDDTRRMQAAPRALAQAAWLTLSKAISAIFTGNSGAGPTMSDGLALFHANHGNLGSTALSVSSYAAARTAMRKQTELNSGERLGALTAPRYLLVPPDLEITALQVLGSDLDYSYALANGTAAPANPLSEEGATQAARMQFARERVIVVDLWTDTSDWAAVADPLMYPAIGLGFRYGRTPEIFSVASPTAGLMFSNDVMPVKVRFFFAAGPTDWRGLYKANVA